MISNLYNGPGIGGTAKNLEVLTRGSIQNEMR
jgi:hypothetical protein